MIDAVVALLVLALTVFLLLIGFKGRSLRLFSPEVLKSSRLTSFAPSRWILYAVVGGVWLQAKIHIPGTETALTYGFDNRLGRVMRAAYWKSRVKHLGRDVIIEVGAKAIGWNNISIGDRSCIDRNVILETGKTDKNSFSVYEKKVVDRVKEGELVIGKGCHISKNVVIQSFGGVIIGDYSGIASGAKIYSLSHHYKKIGVSDKIVYKFSPFAPHEEQSLIKGSVVLEGNNALGLNSVILPGVTVGKNSWVGVCSYVVDDIPPNCLAMGCPAKVTKLLCSDRD